MGRPEDCFRRSPGGAKRTQSHFRTVAPPEMPNEPNPISEHSRRTAPLRSPPPECATMPGNRSTGLAATAGILKTTVIARPLVAFGLCCCFASGALALDPRRSLAQYSRTVWTEAQGLPQDTVRAIAQTADGYLWLATDEGLARYDGYEFAVFNKASGDLPANSITSLAAGADGSLWIGTSNGLARLKENRFHTYTTGDGLPDNSIVHLFADHAGTLWVVAGVSLSRFQDGKFSNFDLGPQAPIAPVRIVGEDRRRNLWIAGYAGVVKLSGGKLTQALPASFLDGNAVNAILADRHDNIWVGGSLGLIELSASGAVRRYSRSELPDMFVRALWEDRDGSIWLGGNGGLARLEGGRFVVPGGAVPREADTVRCLLEDREGNLWAGANDGLTRFRDDLFTIYGKTEGLPSDQPTVVYQDRAGRIWVGFHDAGLMLFPGYRLFTARDGLPATEIFSIRETRAGDLLVSTRLGLARESKGRFSIHPAPDPLGRRNVFDALEDSAGRLWLASNAGLSELRGGRDRVAIPGGPLIGSAVVALLEGGDGALWAGTYGKGLWRLQGEEKRLFTVADGLPSDQIRALYQDADGDLWIGAFNGGLGMFRAGRFLKFTAKDGLLSDNIASIEGEGDWLWLSTTRGLCRVSKRQLNEFAERKRASLEPENYGVDDGLRSAQCAAYPTAAGGKPTADGRLWFATNRGLAVLDRPARKRQSPAPVVHLVSMNADGREVNLSGPARLAPGNGRVQIRYSAIHLSAPERVRYSYRLAGLDADWVRAGNRRLVDYNSLGHGRYRFEVRAEAPGAPPAGASFDFELMPHFYETLWFRLACAAPLLGAVWAAYLLRLRAIGNRFALVLEERARLAREIHDTLAQGFVGISSQLDAVAICMPDETAPARKYLDVARRMARHSLTEARRSVMDLRASMLDGRDLGAALESGARVWAAGSGVEVEVGVTGPPDHLPEEMEQNLLRIAQEAVNNALKHAAARKIRIELTTEGCGIRLRIADDGRGFDEKDAFSTPGGHFGLIGMRERAERLGGELRLVSRPGEGTEVEVMAPLP